MIHNLRRTMRFLSAVWLIAALAGCHRTPDEAQVRAAITHAASAAEAADAGGVTGVLSDDFSGNDGELDRKRLAGMLHLIKLRGDHVGVTLGPLHVERRGDRIMADFTATLTSGGRLLPSELGVYKVQTAWRRDGGDWLCYWAHWTRPL